MTEATTEYITRLCKILKGIDTRYIMGEKPNEYIYKYPDGYKEYLQQRIAELQAEWRKNNPDALLNGDG